MTQSSPHDPAPPPDDAPAAPAPGDAALSSSRHESADGNPTLGDLLRQERQGSLFVIEGTDGSGRSTQIAMLGEWLESQGYAVRTIGLRRSHLMAKNIDKVLAQNVVGRLTLALLYATDFYDQLTNVMIPSLRAGYVILADRYIYTLIARAEVRGIKHAYLNDIYSLALRPDLTFWLDICPETAFDREFHKANAIGYWESGRDLYLSDDLYKSFIRYQTLMNSHFKRHSKQEAFIQIDGEASPRTVNAQLRKRIARHLGIKNVRYKPSRALERKWLA
jgi:dTMP kinase